MAKTIRVDPNTVNITVNGSPLSDLYAPVTGSPFAGQTFHMSTDGNSSVGETVSVLMIKPYDRVRLKPHSPIRTVIHVAWVLGAIAVTTDDNLRWYFGVTGDGWPTVERVIEGTMTKTSLYDIQPGDRIMVGSTPREVERVERGPYGDRLAVWWSGEDAPAVFSPDADGWPEVERVTEERR